MVRLASIDFCRRVPDSTAKAGLKGTALLFALRKLASVMCCVVTVGCSLSADADRKQCSDDCDCTERGAAWADSVCINSWCTPDPKWSCLDQPQSLSGDTGPFAVTLRVQDVLEGTPMSGVEARLCPNYDVNCENPETATVTSDEFGVVRFEIRPRNPSLGFTGFVLLTRADLMPGMFFFSRPIDRAVDIPAVQLLSPAAVGILTQRVGSRFDPERGLVLVSTMDCEDEPADGVSLTTDDTDELSSSFYSVVGSPTAAAIATDKSGYAGLLNVPPGRIAVTGRLDMDGRILRTISLYVKAGSITYSRMEPLGA